MKTIIITGRDRDIYNILKENRIRMKRHGLEITGDTDIERPSIVADRIAAENNIEELRKEAKGLKIKGFAIMKASTLKKKIEEAKKPKQKEEKKALKTKEEKHKPTTK
ncbi:MAG: hypothetical protein ACUZ8E_05660 [Candidatus Anammoxibacter sp.]